MPITERMWGYSVNCDKCNHGGFRDNRIESVSEAISNALAKFGLVRIGDEVLCEACNDD